ncbi:MAG: ABC transporter substrate-binding protein [Anaerolineales bacterium]|jgi:NitT/TauT family transport system substrate-binding protein
MRKLALLSIATAALMGACSPVSGGPEQLEKVSLTMSFRPDVQFAPMYMAVEKGYAAENGLEVSFNHLPETEAVQLVGVDQLQFAVVSGEQVLLARAQGLPVVYVMAWWQDYPVAVAAPEDSGIVEPADLEGRRIGIPGLFGASYIGFRALLDWADLTEQDVTLDSIGYTQVEALSQGLDEAVVVYANNEPVQLASLGMPVNLIKVADYVHLASNGLITNEVTLREDPELVHSMVATLVEGIEATLVDPDEAFEVSKIYVEGLAEANEDVQREVLERSLPFWRNEMIGFSDAVGWENMQAVLLDMQLLNEAVDVNEAFTNEFLPE